jgi:hypothetical protein
LVLITFGFTGAVISTAVDSNVQPTTVLQPGAALRVLLAYKLFAVSEAVAPVYNFFSENQFPFVGLSSLF